MQIINGHTLALLRSETDRISLLSDFFQFCKRAGRGMILALSEPDLDILSQAFRIRGPGGGDPFDGAAIFPASALLTNGRLEPRAALDWMSKQWREISAKGHSAVGFALDLRETAQNSAEESALCVFESSLEEFCAGPSVSAVTLYSLEGERGFLTELLRAPKQIWMDGEPLSNPYYTPARELFGPDSRSALANQMLDNLQAHLDRDTLLDSEDLLRALFREIDVGFALYEAHDKGENSCDFYVVQSNPALDEINGISPGRMIGKNAASFFPMDAPETVDIFSETALSGMSARFERYHEDSTQHFEIIAFRPKQGLCAALVTDISERKRLEETKQKSEFRIRQTQKMEAIGRLAGGVAHDFNNILTAIVGLTNVLMEELPAHTAQWSDVEEIKKAADRAASLTRQLLAFSRKQEVTPKIVNLNRIIEDSHRMLSRIIGEDIRLTFIPGEALKPVRIDPGYMEQVLANFAANSRDAMPHGGELVLETGNVRVREPQVSVHGELLPGNYVQLSARDSGVGMNESVQERIFEPFFTTKDKGKGTGLGLATVYGIVRQHEGIITVRSDPGTGTTFDVYFPWADSQIPEAADDTAQKLEPGNAVVLLAEDEETVRNLTRRILERNGYRVFAAADGEDAQRMWPSLKNEVDLLLTDVIMPGMNGLELYQRLHDDKPELKVLYISGYPEDVIAEQGASAARIELLEKPFSPAKLLAKIQAILTQ